MSSMIYFKIPFEGPIDSIFKLIKDREWNAELKFPEKGIMLMKTSSENEDEISFNQNIVFDESTNSKFGKFDKITEKEFENAVSIENLETNDNEQKEKENEQKSDLGQASKTDNNNNQVESFGFKKTKSISKKIEFNFGKSTNPFEEFGKKISNEYNDPYDFFFSQKYLVPFFIFAIICQIIFGL